MFQFRPKSIDDKYRREIHWLNRKIRNICNCPKRDKTKAQIKSEILKRIKWLKDQLKKAKGGN
jgi:hypothetical protein